MRQLALFDDVPGPGSDPDGRACHADGRPQPAPCSPGLVDIARRLDPRLRLGTSSWSFPGWAGLVYAAPASKQVLSRQGLAAYASHPLLRTVGVDSGFYAPLDARRLAAYAAQTPADFRFLVKAPATLTDPRPRGPSHDRVNRGFLDPGRALAEAVSPFVEGLGPRAGVLLFQFPPLGRSITTRPRRFAEDLYRFLRDLPKGPTYAVELRDRELLTADLVAALHHGGATAGLAGHPRLPGLGEQMALFGDDPAHPLVIRWLLRPNRGYEEARDLYRPFSALSEPDTGSRSAIVALVQRALGQGREAMVIVNNKAEGSSPLSLGALAAALVDGA
jgi:uncharacterized protein YecE (DUF72 family)